MNLKSLSVASMIMVTGRWLSGEARATIDGLALCRSLLGKLDEVHQGLIVVQPQQSNLNSAVKDARAAVNLCDGTFDSRGRGLFRALQAFESLSEDPNTAAIYTAAREAIFPKGLSVLMLPYLQEVGEARLAKQRLRQEQREVLDRTPLGPFTVGETFDRWLAAADDLETKLKARDTAEAALLSAPDLISSAAAHEAKLDWVRTVRAFLTNLELESTDANTRSTLLKTLQEEVARAAPPSEAPAKNPPAVPNPSPAAADVASPSQPPKDPPQNP